MQNFLPTSPSLKLPHDLKSTLIPEARRNFCIGSGNMIHHNVSLVNVLADDQFVPFFQGALSRAHDVFTQNGSLYPTQTFSQIYSVASAIQHPHCARHYCAVQLGSFWSHDPAIVTSAAPVRRDPRSAQIHCAHAKSSLLPPLAFFRTKHNRVRVPG